MGKILVVLACCLAFSGCGPVSRPPGHPVVTSVSIAIADSGEETLLRFSTDRETTPVLDYLRKLGTGSQAPVNPEYTAGPMYTFTLQYSDGSAQTLRQKADRYFIGSDGVWKVISTFPKAGFAAITQR